MRTPVLAIAGLLLVHCGEMPANADGGAGGGSSGGGMAAGGIAGGTTAGGATAGGTSGGTTAGGNAAGGSTSGGSAAGGNAAGGSTSGGNTAGGSTSGGTAGGSTAGGNPFANVDPLMGTGPVEKIDGGFLFTEGPQWVPALGSLLFSDIQGNRIWRMTPPRTFQSFLSPSGNSNGIALAPNGDLIICQHAGQVSRRFPDGGMTVIARTLDAGTLNSPNDAVVHSNGTIYFTDPTYGGTGTVPVRGVYRIALDGTISLIFGVNSSQPNGVTLSPDESILYVSDSQASMVRRVDLQPDGVPFPRPNVLFTNTSAGGPGGAGGDGITTDVNGNLYVSTSAGVKVYRPDAGYLGVITVPEEPANCAFGEADHRTLFITARTGLYRVRLNVPGPY